MYVCRSFDRILLAHVKLKTFMGPMAVHKAFVHRHVSHMGEQVFY